MEKLLIIKEYTLWTFQLADGQKFVFTQEQPDTSNKFLSPDGVFRYGDDPFPHDFQSLEEVLTAFKKHLQIESFAQILTTAINQYNMHYNPT